ncbi:HipA family kinase [Clostridium paraputrificum]|uniref:HipA family kinase n=1 Tax=Clostridium TaxID=1485 RepID=UPI002900E7DF|nr:HipA family kinase [Clostridium sp.]MDU2282265.1 HipA family kinase [Clostridium sp.]
MDIIHIDELLFPIGNGITIPIHGTSNGLHYIVKTFNNVEGNKTLINELVCYLIAKKLSLPIPDAKLGIIDKNTKIDENVSELEDFSEDCFGLAFCSTYLNPVTTISSSKMLKLSSNYKWLLPKLMLFDHLVYNKDRNKGNLLISLSKNNNQLFIIDHSHTFNLEAIWNSIGLEQKMQEFDIYDDRIMLGNWYHYSKFKTVSNIDILTMKDTVNYFRENLSKDFFESLVDNIPEVWENDKEEIRALIKYLLYRFEHLDVFADIIANTNY